jgi:hypothetical protein
MSASIIFHFILEKGHKIFTESLISVFNTTRRHDSKHHNLGTNAVPMVIQVDPENGDGMLFRNISITK